MSNKKDKTSLTDMKDGQTGTIISIRGGKHATKRLADLGLSTGIEIEILRTTLFRGPIQIEVSGSKLVLGRGLASKIFVEIK